MIHRFIRTPLLLVTPLLFLSGVNIPLKGCKPPNPIPSPTPTPSVSPTPQTTPPPSTLPSPAPSPSPSPAPSPPTCAKPSGQGAACTDNQPGVYAGDVTAALGAVSGCPAGVSCLLGDQAGFTVQVMRFLEKQGYCVLYDLTGGNAGLNSEMGVRKSDQFDEWYQIVASSGHVRWPNGGVAQSKCSPPATGSTANEVAVFFKVSLCPLQRQTLDGYALSLEISKGGQQVDGTPYITDTGGVMPPPGWTGNCRGPHRCDISPEKDIQNGLACTLALCGDRLSYAIVDHPPGAWLNWPFPDGTRPDGASSYAAKFTMAAGRTSAMIQGCCSDNSSVCGHTVIP